MIDEGRTEAAPRAVIVDDCRVMRRMMRSALESLAFEVTEYASADEAAERFPWHTPPTVAFVDLHMPGMNGIELIECLRADQRCDPMFIVLVTSELLAERRQQALARGADAFIPKPFGVDSVRSSLEGLGFAWLAAV